MTSRGLAIPPDQKASPDPIDLMLQLARDHVQHLSGQVYQFLLVDGTDGSLIGRAACLGKPSLPWLRPPAAVNRRCRSSVPVSPPIPRTL